MDIASKLKQVIPAARVHTRLIDRLAYANDASYFRLVPQAVVQPNSISEIQSLFKFTQQNKIPMTFRAAGTSLSGSRPARRAQHCSDLAATETIGLPQLAEAIQYRRLDAAF